VHIETVFSKRLLATNCLVLTSDYPYISISPPRGMKNVSVNIPGHWASMALLRERVQYYILLQTQHIQDLEDMLKVTLNTSSASSGLWLVPLNMLCSSKNSSMSASSIGWIF